MEPADTVLGTGAVGEDHDTWQVPRVKGKQGSALDETVESYKS